MKCTEKEAAKEAKGKGKCSRKPKNGILKAEDASADKENRSWKRKSAALEVDALELKAKKVRISKPLEL